MMRSSVSYILSSSASEPNMSHPDYEQFSHDHAALLVLVRHIGSQLAPDTYNAFYERINTLCNCVKITDSTGLERSIAIRYLKEYPVENNDWGDFQTHRRLLGLITLGKFDSQQELNEICRVHESLKVKYTNTLYDSRCILFKPAVVVEGDAIELEGESEGVSNSSEDQHKEKVHKLIEKLREERRGLTQTGGEFTTPSNFKSRALFDVETDVDLEAHMIEFVNSLFWVLESKRLERSREKLERVSMLLLAPFEKKDFVGLDMESRNNKKRCTGRVTKHLGDLCLQAGLAHDALTYYTAAADTLKSINDWLWLGAAYEGLCAASALLHYPNMRYTNLNPITPPPTSTAMLSIEEIPKKYREAIIHYSKYQNAGIVETEASFKAARISVEQQHSLQASSFLQNVVFINLTLSESEKIVRFETLSQLYTQIGFTRKAAFCDRLAASRYVSAQNPTPNWNQCYQLMLRSFPGHLLTTDPTEMLHHNHGGWPNLQIHLLQELVVAAKRMGHSALATRHMTFLLQTMWPHLTTIDQKELPIQLQSLSAQCEGAPIQLVMDNGLIIPPANLTNIPLCVAFTCKNMQPHLMPKKIVTLKQDNGPFLFTPINFGQNLERKSDQPQSKIDFLWVENDPCEVRLKLINPLPFELKVANMRLLTGGGIVFESMPETVVLPPFNAAPISLTLNGIPKESGPELELYGYSTHALGIKSNCLLKHMKMALPEAGGRRVSLPPQYTIEVIPSLPILEVKTSLPQSATFSTFQNFENVVTSANVTLYHGQAADCVITITNTSQIPVEMVELSIQSALVDVNLQNEIFKWSQAELEQQLPLQPGDSATLTLTLYSAANFLAPPDNSAQHESFTNCASTMSHSLPSTLNSPMNSSSFHSRRNDLNSSSFRSSNSGQSSIYTTTSYNNQLRDGRSPIAPIQVGSSALIVEGQLQLRYSGGGGLEAGYCRGCSIFLTLEMLPSLQVTNWDVLPAETSSQFYLVLDVANLTAHEMELQYTPGKHMLIEGHESCRVPIPVDRCPLSKLGRLYMDQHRLEGEVMDLHKICSEHIADLVDLRWQLMSSDVDTRGRASLKGLSLSSAMLDIVRMSPLDWDVRINGEAIKVQQGVSCEAGDCLEVHVKITNSLQRPLRQLTMSSHFYQDYQSSSASNGANYRLETRLATTGPSKVILASLDHLEQAEHRFNVIFFTPGQYKMDVKVVLAAPNTQQQDTVWRFIPPVEFNVLHLMV